MGEGGRGGRGRVVVEEMGREATRRLGLGCQGVGPVNGGEW